MSDKLRAAAKAARDAMRMAKRSHGEILLTYPPLDSWVHHRVDQRLDDAIKAVEAALVEPAIKESLTVEEPEPVAWMNKHGACVSDVFKKVEADVKEYTTPLYAAPPRREWIGLTDEEVWEILWETQSAELDAHGDVGSRKKSLCSLAIEAKLREKNGG